VKPELRLSAAWAALLFATLYTTPVDAAVPLLFQIEPRPPETLSAPPKVEFSIPKYSIPQVERETVAACLVLEAASQGDFGMRSVMSVVRNRSRARPELFALTVLRPKQFSALNKLTAGRESLANVVTRAKRDRMWSTALQIVDDAAQESWHDPTGGATHYTRTGERTRWTSQLAMTVTIGAHSFYR
jgi:spore germination cell wall hydrolase CwlJ-like protein